MIVRAESGVLSTVILNEKTQYKRMAPGAKSLTGAADITLADVGSGDRVWARWRPGTDQTTVPAAQLVVMSKADLAKKQEAERAEWRKRGVSGIVSSVNPSTREITVSSSSLTGQTQSVIIPITDKVLMRRYPPDTVPKYSEAKPSKFEEVKVDDQLRALGDKSTDGTRLTAEEVVFGTFKLVGGTVTAIERHLMSGGFVHRYDTTKADDGLPPGEGVFLACSFWLANSLCLIGRRDEAVELFERLLALRNDLGLLSEEYDPMAKRLLGNFPQAFSHTAIVNTAAHLAERQTGAVARGNDD